MQIEQENFTPNNKENRKEPKTLAIIATLIFVTIIVVIGIIFAIISMTGTKLSVVVDGKTVNVSSDTFIFTEDRKSIYINKRYCSICKL